MSLKHKALGLGVLAMLATGCLSVAGTSATTGGHFVISQAHARIFGTQFNDHRLEYTFHGLEGGVVCDSALYEGTTTESTVTQLDLAPTYANCHTTDGTNVTIDVNGCFFRFTVASGAEPEQTVDIVCTFGKFIEITHPQCTYKIPAQNNLSGATYTAVTEDNTHKLTVDANVQFSVQYESGFCVLLGTSHTGTLKGSMTLNADTTELKTLDLTAT